MPANEETAVKRRQEIYQAALTCFLRKGYYRATMDDIVAESGLSKGTLYWYFKSKKELFLSLFQEFMGEMGISWDAIADDQSLSAVEKVKASLDLFRQELAEFGPYFGIMMEAWALTRQDEDVQVMMAGMYEPYQKIMLRILNEGIAASEFQVADPEATALAIITLYDGMTLAAGLDFASFDWNRVMVAAEKMVMCSLGVTWSYDGGHDGE